jgi:Domain of unknown function (DUF6456)
MQNTSNTVADSRDYADLFKFIGIGPQVTKNSNPKFVTLKAEGKRLEVPLSDIALLASNGMIQRVGQNLHLTQKARALMSVEGQAQNHSIISLDEEFVALNGEESPLASLAKRKSPDGQRFLTVDEMGAGERLRLDFTRSMLMPRTSANWQASVSCGRRSDGGNGIEDITLAAMHARNALDAALQCLGHDLAGVVTDICCFLKGFEQVELERRWPKRSAKFMLKAALAILALHYNPPAKQTMRSHKWGSADYRPHIS